jgi:alpha-beta hydrolase superfamily lysophospholipase
MVSEATTFTFDDAEGFEIFVRRWEPDGPPRAVLQIAHGAVEHSARYERLALFLNDAGIAVYAPDHRGHGETAGTIERAGIAGPDGWNGIVRDFARLGDIIAEEHPGLPVFVLGHSMGSIVAQQYIQEHGARLAGAILTGSWGTFGDTSEIVAALSAAIEESGRDAPSMAWAEMFGTFNEPFGGETGFEWLSRDQREVEKYVDDPWSGSFAFSNGLVIDFLDAMDTIWLAENEARIPKHLPVLIASGDKDPAGGMSETTEVLVGRYQALGLHDLTAIFYPDARHEILNETNRDQVQADILDWIDDRLS